MNHAEAYLFHSAHIDVQPARLYWQDGGRGLRSLTESTHAVSAAAILAGGDPAATLYAAEQRLAWNDGSVEGRPEAFAELVRGMAGGWRGDGRVEVAIEGSGRIVLTDGLHRSAAALAAGLSAIPCRIVYRDAAWLALKHALLAVARGLGRSGPYLYQPIDHPDLRWPSWRADTAARAEAIAAWLREHAPRACWGLDYACHTGVLTCALAQAGYSMQGMDSDEAAIRAARLLAEMDAIGCGRDAGGRLCATFGMSDRPPTTIDHGPDFAICLSVLNHHASDGRTSEGHAIFRALVEVAPFVFLDCPSPGEPVGGDSDLVNPATMLAWCAASGAPGAGEVIAERGARLQRTLMVWHRR